MFCRLACLWLSASTRSFFLLPPLLPPLRGTSTTFAPVDFGDHRLDGLSKRCYVLFRDGPDDFVIHIVIVVAKYVADAANLRPGNVGMSVGQVFRQSPRCLGNDLDVSLDRAPEQFVGEIVRKLAIGRLLLDEEDRIADVMEALARRPRRHRCSFRHWLAITGARKHLDGFGQNIVFEKPLEPSPLGELNLAAEQVA